MWYRFGSIIIVITIHDALFNSPINKLNVNLGLNGYLGLQKPTIFSLVVVIYGKEHKHHTNGSHPKGFDNLAKRREIMVKYAKAINDEPPACCCVLKPSTD